MDSSSSSNNAPGYPSFLASLKNCQGCQKRKEYIQDMLTSGKFWTGVVIGVAGCYAYHRFVKKM